MRSTGIEPVSHPWKGGILPLNHERFMESLSIHCIRILFSTKSNALIYSLLLVMVQLSPLVIPSQVSFLLFVRSHNSFFLASSLVEVVVIEK